MKLHAVTGDIEVIDELCYSFGSEDNLRAYPVELYLSKEPAMVSAHGVLLNGEPLAVFGASGGATGIHAHSAVLVGQDLCLAICNMVVCAALDAFAVKWAVNVDEATCFGIYYQRERNALFSHGELEIARLTTHGEIVWRASGADIFSEGFELLDEGIKVTDFNGKVYLFDYETGKDV
jgi:hypothetical protein